MRNLACGLTVAFGLLANVLPASAEVQKLMNRCDGKLCPFFRAMVTAPEGWAEDKEATDYYKAVMLLPTGQSFDTAPAKIYAVARFNGRKQPITDFLPDSIKGWKNRAKGARISKLDDLPRDGKPAFVRHRFEAPKLKEQGYELQAVTSDTDSDGNSYVITITLSADTAAAFKAAQPAYHLVLTRY